MPRPKRDRPLVPPEKQCRATTRGLAVRGTYWSPPKRCGNYAGPDGYCWQHRRPQQPTEAAPPEEHG